MSELKPCPKCNGEASIEYENYDYDGGDWWLIREADVVCLECGLVFHAENKSREYQQGEHCLDFIIEAWNTRAERTCEEFGSVRVWQECDVWSHELSCGHEVDTLDMEPPNFCPTCGARIIGDDA